MSLLCFVGRPVQTGVMGRGALRIYLGAAPGVGKTYAMLNEGRRRQARGTDVVVGYVETHGRSGTAEQVGDLEIVPPVTLDSNRRSRPEMDVDALIARRPQVALVDELAHTNRTGSRNPKRWQDVQELLDAGIDVVSTLNIHHLESVSDVVDRITGVVQPETIPDEIVRDADQVELVDATPEALRRRMAHGNIYAPDDIGATGTSYFQKENLAALRELTLLWMVDQVDTTSAALRRLPGRGEGWETRERVVVGVTAAPGTEHLLRRAARIAQRAHGELIGVHIRAPGSLAEADEELPRHGALLKELGGRYQETTGADVATGLIDFARGENATQIVLGATNRNRWTLLAQGSVVNRVVRLAGSIDVHVISREPPSNTSAARPKTSRHPGPAALVGGGRLIDAARRKGSPLSPRRRLAGWLLVLTGLPVLTAVLTQLRDQVTLSSDLLLYLLFVVVAAAVGGLASALVAAVAGTLLVNWFFTPPLHAWTIARGADVLALVVYLGAAAIVSTFVSIAAHRSLEAGRANTEAETLAAVASGTVESDPLPVLMTHLQKAFGLAGVSLLRVVEGQWVTETAVGEAPLTPDGADETHDLADGLVLALSGKALAAKDRRVLNAFTANLAASLDRRRLHARAAEAGALAEANQLRSALLQAVSHDLRTPLASIKASVSSLRQPDIAWTPAESTEFLATIEDETDRLT
ncbi:MAG: DUF4118 domain-containing protein, partial [Acidimicrobiaceae bacterium]|nr:DUF4118 domain-containing protein [Acidimicrobiaceae bacterium]